MKPHFIKSKKKKQHNLKPHEADKADNKLRTPSQKRVNDIVRYKSIMQMIA